MKKIIILILAVMLTISALPAFATEYTDKETVKQVQQALNDAGYDCGTPDGAAGNKTKTAIMVYQAANRLEVTGTINDELLAALGLVEKEQSNSDSAVIVGGTGIRPSATPMTWEQQTLAQSIVPFCQLTWGMSRDEDIAAINAQYTESDGNVETEINIPGIDGSKTVIFSFDDDGLERATIVLFDNALVNKITIGDFTTTEQFEDRPESKSIQQIIADFYDTSDAYRIKLDHNKNDKYAYTAYFTDKAFMVFGIIARNDDSIIGAEFIKPAKLDEEIIRSSNRYDIQLANIKKFNMQGEEQTTLYYSKTDRMFGFDTNYSLNTSGMHTYNVFISAIEMRFSFLNPIVTVPVFYFCYSYAGTVKPENVNTFNFMVDNKLYSFNPTSSTQTTATQYNEYTKAYYFAVGETNSEFMEALANTTSPVTVQISGDNGFVMNFEMPEESRKQLVDDWELFKEADGAHDFFLINSMEQPCIIR